MGDLSEFQPKTSRTVDLIYEHYKRVGDAEPQRGYLGASIVGHECDRYLWYVFRGAVREDVEGRMYRLWQTGHLEEPRLVADLRAIGCEVFTHDVKGEQFAISDLGGHFSGHLDGVVKGVPEAPATPHVGEFKTHKASSFADLKKHGVKVSKPQHWAQMQAYMGHMKLTRALYLARNKDTDELWSERVEFDPHAFKALMARAKRIIETSHGPEKCSNREDDWRCRMCPAQALCWGLDDKRAVPLPGQTCRSCVHATPVTDEGGAQWDCSRYRTRVPNTDAGAKCPTHLLLPAFVTFAEATDSDEDWIEFTNRVDGAKWRHGSAPGGQWTTAALMAGRGPLDPQRAPDPHVATAATSAVAPDSSNRQGGVAGTPVSRSRQHVAFRCAPGENCDAAWCGYCDGTLFLCAVCGRAEAELAPECPGRTLKAAIESGETLTGDEARRAREAIDEAAGRAAAEAALLAVDFADLPLLARYPWEDSERVWDGPVGELEAALELERLDAVLLDGCPPKRTQDDEQVNAAEYTVDGNDYMIVHYKADGQAAIWRGKA